MLVIEHDVAVEELRLDHVPMADRGVRDADAQQERLALRYALQVAEARLDDQRAARLPAVDHLVDALPQIADHPRRE